MVARADLPFFVFLISDIAVFISLSLIWAFLYLTCFYFLNIESTVSISILMSLSIISNICIDSGLVIIDFFPS